MKSQFQDIIPPEKRSIRNVPLPRDSNSKDEVHHPKHKSAPHKHSKKEATAHSEVKEPDEIKVPEEQDPWVYESKEELKQYNGDGRSRTSKVLIWVIAGVCLVSLFFAISWLFAGATVRVALKKVTLPLSGSMLFYLEPEVNSIGYSTLSVSDTASREIAASGEKAVSSSAEGTIVIYNNYNSSPQRLVAGTRFKTPQGLIYKIKDAVTVPGKDKNTPGSIQVSVTAEKPGDSYNIDLTDFTIPGFEGDPRYESFYARSKTPMSGGASGTVPVVNESEKASVVLELKEGLKATLLERVRKELPPTSTAISGLEDLVYSISESSATGGRASIAVTATIKLYVIDTATLARSLLSAEGVSVSSEDAFVIDASGASATTTSVASSTLRANLNGKVTIQYALDSEKFKSDIVGKSREEIVAVVNSRYPQVTTITTEIRPFWRADIPEDTDRITVIKE